MWPAVSSPLPAERQGRGEGGVVAVGGDLEVGGVAGFGFGDRVEDGGVVDQGAGSERGAEGGDFGAAGGGGVEVAFGVDGDADGAGEVRRRRGCRARSPEESNWAIWVPSST